MLVPSGLRNRLGKNEVEDGLADVWELVYSSTQSGIWVMKDGIIS